MHCTKIRVKWTPNQQLFFTVLLKLNICVNKGVNYYNMCFSEDVVKWKATATHRIIACSRSSHCEIHCGITVNWSHRNTRQWIQYFFKCVFRNVTCKLSAILFEPHYTSAQCSCWIGILVSPCPSFCLSVCLSLDGFMSALKLPQHWPQSFHFWYEKSP